MNAKEVRQKNEAELTKELLDLRKAQFSLRMQLATQQLNNTSQLGKVRKDIARIKTIQRQKAHANHLDIFPVQVDHNGCYRHSGQTDLCTVYRIFHCLQDHYRNQNNTLTYDLIR